LIYLKANQFFTITPTLQTNVTQENFRIQKLHPNSVSFQALPVHLHAASLAVITTRVSGRQVAPGRVEVVAIRIVLEVSAQVDAGRMALPVAGRVRGVA
jgi:hypothetical protein